VIAQLWVAMFDLPCCTLLAGPQDYNNALKLATGAAQRDTVYQAMGADAAAVGDFKAAGAHYGRIVGGRPPFEELALLLVESGDPEALQVFLSTKLQVCRASLPPAPAPAAAAVWCGVYLSHAVCVGRRAAGPVITDILSMMCRTSTNNSVHDSPLLLNGAHSLMHVGLIRGVNCALPGWGLVDCLVGLLTALGVVRWGGGVHGGCTGAGAQ
jgi:hypothetical protein